MAAALSLCGEQSDAFEVQPRLAVQSALAGAAWWQPSLVPSLCLLSPQCSQRLEQWRGHIGHGGSQTA